MVITCDEIRHEYRDGTVRIVEKRKASREQEAFLARALWHCVIGSGLGPLPINSGIARAFSCALLRQAHSFAPESP